jgi:hypothetical protein
MVYVTRPYRNFAPFVRRTGERKAPAYAKAVYQQLITVSLVFAANSHCVGQGNLAGSNLCTESTKSFAGAASLSSSEFIPLRYWLKNASV